MKLKKCHFLWKQEWNPSSDRLTEEAETEQKAKSDKKLARFSRLLAFITISMSSISVNISVTVSRTSIRMFAD